MALRGILLDTNAYTAFMLGRPEAREIIRRAESISLSVTVLGELQAGFAAGNREPVNPEEIARFMESPRVQLLTMGEVTAAYYARVYAALRRKGKPIPTNDLWIAASALEYGLRLFSYDGHFSEVDGLIAGSSAPALLL